MKRAGFVLNTNICPHFAIARVDLFNVIKVRKIRTFGEVMGTVGIDKNAIGCEICKPAIGSILSSLYVLFSHLPPHMVQSKQLLMCFWEFSLGITNRL